MTRLNRHDPRERGQVLPLFALFLVALLAIASLAIDVSSAYAARRMYREIADASSLAGAQDLQTTSRAITTANRTAARQHAYDVVKSRLGGGNLVAAACDGNVTDFSADIADCPVPNTGYKVSIKTPSPTCVTCDPAHSIQVTVRNPTYPLSFARVLGFSTWNVGSTSIAGLTFASKYALMTLQPPHPRPNGSDSLLMKDLIVNANNTVLNVLQGDVGTNTSAATTNQGVISLANGYFIDHYDDLSASGDTWSKPDGVHPVGRHITQLILDPQNPYPVFPLGTTPKFNSQSSGETPCTGANYPTDYGSVLTGVVKCYRPGIYADPQGFRVGTGVGSPDSAYLMPGAYSMTTGLTIRGTIAGGLINQGEGVVIVLPQNQVLDANNSTNVLLNAGGSTCSTDTCRATPAVDVAGTQIKTAEGFVLTIEVGRDNSCFTGVTPVDGVCNVNGNNTVNLAGNGTLSVAGVIYGPSDNMTVHANQTTQTGLVGQIISWSVTYTGGATLNQRYPGNQEIGVVRLDAGCTAPSTPCNP